MNCFDDPFLPVIEHDIHAQLFLCQEQANEARELEQKSSVALQRWWRSILRKRQLQREAAAAKLIQRVWRGHAGRSRFQQLRKYKKQIQEEEYYHFMARKIQSVWRSYKSRCNPDSMYNMSRRRRLQYSSALSGQQWKEEVSRLNEETVARAQEQDQQYRSDLMYLQRQRIHALLSTSAQRSVQVQHDSRVEVVLHRILSKELTVDQFMRMDQGDATKLCVLVQQSAVLDRTSGDVEATVKESRHELAAGVVKKHRDFRKSQFLETFGHAAVNLRKSFTQSMIPSQAELLPFHKTTEMVSIQPVHAPSMRDEEEGVQSWTSPYSFNVAIQQPPTRLPQRSPQDLSRVLAAMMQRETQLTGSQLDTQRACRVHVERVLEHTLLLIEKRQVLQFVPLEAEYFEGPAPVQQEPPEETKDEQQPVQIGAVYGETRLERKQQGLPVLPYQCTGNAALFAASMAATALYNAAPSVKDLPTLLTVPRNTQASTGSLTGVSMRHRAIDSCFTGSLFDGAAQELAGFRGNMVRVKQPVAPVSLLRRFLCVTESAPTCIPIDVADHCVGLPKKTQLEKWSDTDLLRVCRKSKKKYRYYAESQKAHRGNTVDMKKIKTNPSATINDVDDSIIVIVGNDAIQFNNEDIETELELQHLQQVPGIELQQSSTNEIIRLHIATDHETPSIVFNGVPVHVLGLGGPLRSLLKVGLSALRKRLEFGKDNAMNFIRRDSNTQGPLVAGSVLQCRVLVPVIPASTAPSRGTSRNVTPSNMNRQDNNNSTVIPAVLPALSHGFKQGDSILGQSITKPGRAAPVTSNTSSTAFQGANISFHVTIERYFAGLPAVGVLSNLRILTCVQPTDTEPIQQVQGLQWAYDRDQVEKLAKLGDFFQDCVIASSVVTATTLQRNDKYVITMDDLADDDGEEEDEDVQDTTYEQAGSCTPTSTHPPE